MIFGADGDVNTMSFNFRVTLNTHTNPFVRNHLYELVGPKVLVLPVSISMITVLSLQGGGIENVNTI